MSVFLLRCLCVALSLAKSDAFWWAATTTTTTAAPVLDASAMWMKICRVIAKLTGLEDKDISSLPIWLVAPSLIGLCLWFARDSLGPLRNVLQYLIDFVDGFRFKRNPTMFQLECKNKGLDFDTYRELSRQCSCAEDLLDLSIDSVVVKDIFRTRLKNWKDILEEVEKQKRDFRIIVAGETSDGKTTLINSLLEKDIGETAPIDGNPEGTTKHVTGYPCRAPWFTRKFKLVNLVLYDIPGFGDSDVNPMSILQQIEAEQKKQDRPFHALLLCAKATDGAMKQGTRLVHDMVKIAFRGVDDILKWQCVAWVGTHGDQCTTEKKNLFKTKKLEMLNKVLTSGKIERACVIDCQPLERVDFSPNLKDLRDLILELVEHNVSKDLKLEMDIGTSNVDDQLKALPLLALQARGIMDIGDAKTDADVKKKILEAASNLYGDSFENIQKAWEEDQKRKDAELKAALLKAANAEKAAQEGDRKRVEEQKTFVERLEKIERELLDAKSEKAAHLLQQHNIWCKQDVFCKKPAGFFNRHPVFEFAQVVQVLGDDAFQIEFQDGYKAEVSRADFLSLTSDVKQVPVWVPHSKTYNLNLPAPPHSVYVEPVTLVMNDSGATKYRFSTALSNDIIHITREDTRAAWRQPWEIMVWIKSESESRARLASASAFRGTKRSATGVLDHSQGRNVSRRA